MNIIAVMPLTPHPQRQQPGMADSDSSELSSPPSNTGKGTFAESMSSARPFRSMTNGKRHVGAEDELSVEKRDDVQAKRPRIKVKSTPVKRARLKWDDPAEMLTDSKSPLGTASLRDLLLTLPQAWDLLPPEGKAAVLSFLKPEEILNPNTPDARPDVTILANNDNFRNDCARYQEDLRGGRHDPEWIRQARNAHLRRNVGFYAEFQAAKFEEDWGMKMPSALDEKADAGAEEVNDAPEEKVEKKLGVCSGRGDEEPSSKVTEQRQDETKDPGIHKIDEAVKPARQWLPDTLAKEEPKEQQAKPRSTERAARAMVLDENYDDDDDDDDYEDQEGRDGVGSIVVAVADESSVGVAKTKPDEQSNKKCRMK